MVENLSYRLVYTHGVDIDTQSQGFFFKKFAGIMARQGVTGVGVGKKVGKTTGFVQCLACFPNTIRCVSNQIDPEVAAG